MQILIPENIEFILNALSHAGFKAYIVGGCVRDYLLGLPAGDYDICTDAPPAEVINLFSKTVNTGIKHGTVTVIEDGVPVEVTTFRTDGDYSDSRRPDTVRFIGDLKGDLSRRDFTVNAMCYNKEEGLIDCFGGLNDLNHKTLRAVGDPDLRFGEDALRILRLFRFASTLSFTPEKATFKAAIAKAHLIKNISAQRIEKELKKTASGKNPAAVLPLIKTGVLPTLKAENSISKIPLLPDNESLKFFAFLYLLSDCLPEILDFLKCSNAFKKYALSLGESTDKPIDTRADIKRLLGDLENSIFDLFAFKSAITGTDCKEAERTANEIIKTHEPYRINQLAVSGRDIAAKGYSGAEINEKLESLLEKVIAYPELNSRQTLLNLI